MPEVINCMFYISVTFNCDRAVFYYGFLLEGFHSTEGDRNRKL